VSITEKHKAFHEAHDAVARIDETIAAHETSIEQLKLARTKAVDALDAAASEAAGEKIAANLAAIEMQDGSFRLVSKSRRGKKTEAHPDGAPPKYPFQVSDKVLAR
jgi:hypothetical protein